MSESKAIICSEGGPLSRYVILWVAHALGMLGTFSPPPCVSNPDMQHGTCVTHVSWCMPGSLTSSFLWSRLRGKPSWHSRRMRSPQYYVSGKRSKACRLIYVSWILGYLLQYDLDQTALFVLISKQGIIDNIIFPPMHLTGESKGFHGRDMHTRAKLLIFA